MIRQVTFLGLMFMALLPRISFAQSPEAPSPSTAPAISTEISPVPSVVSALLDEPEKKKIMTEFKKALNQQKASLAHQERSTLKELKSSQKQKSRKWREDEKKKRRAFFDQHMSGPERREYVQKYLAEKDQFEAELKNELVQFRKNWTEKKQTLNQNQKELEIRFHESLGKGIRPPADLWPSGN